MCHGFEDAYGWVLEGSFVLDALWVRRNVDGRGFGITMQSGQRQCLWPTPAPAAEDVAEV
ncbi:hypothetical protein SAMN05216410_2937 [Sanguibacter gelidistatuariae]|uniref:Uncharacterized protein n=1 Tax=Sanguibacter gelidistatuariae TaxID=1814289 RepID=A0A1G6SWG3_9MICO|nr:hypothetical protein SAMN05216410_2937 [Sanguibacter gelidistatuariae]